MKSVKIGRDKTGSIIEIVNSRAIAPAIQTLNHPPRLVIDLPNANVAVKERFLVAKGAQFTELHVDQFQEAPPVTRVTVDLTEARPYTWDAAGNRLTIRLKPAEDPAAAKAVPPPAPAQPATVPTFSAAAKPAVVPVSSNGAGSAVIVGSRIGSGSSVTASTETAVLHIARGGELHVCPNSTVSVTASKSGQELMFGMSTGTLETHYHIDAGSDAVLTPDFRMLLAGPGDFDYAISTNSHGDTCVRALLGNTASMLVSELMGDRTYQVKPTEQVVFHEGRIDRVSNDVPFDCGCAAPPPPVMRASTQPEPTQVAEANLPPNLQLPSSQCGHRRVHRSIRCCRRCRLPRGLRWPAPPDRKRSAPLPWLRKPPLPRGQRKKICTSRSKRLWSSEAPIARAPPRRLRTCRPVLQRSRTLLRRQRPHRLRNQRPWLRSPSQKRYIADFLEK